jgi:NAD(P) transhydrogenase subunit alpha
LKKLLGLGAQVLVERGAGEAAHIPDAVFREHGATIGETADAFGADIVFKIACPTTDEAQRVRPGALFISLMDVFGEGPAIFAQFAERGVNAIALELIPRITRAQSMDVLSSQANLAGYKAVIEAVHHFGKLLPVFMTAAGSVPQAKVIVLGAGVAGLQAIATARRLGAQVEAYDVRPEVREEIHSLGARFLEIDLDESGSGEGGYAKELSKSSQDRLAEALAAELPKRDIVISTAQIPGRRAPILITEEAVKHMRPGSVVVDLAAGSGGNCPLSEPDRVVVKHDVTIVGHTNLPAQLSNHASLFFSRNLVNLLAIMVKKGPDGSASLVIDPTDEILERALVTHANAVRWPMEKREARTPVGVGG